jgi:catechol 2,3-dioxygenase-like lactoylglutathione lyase family enzyme
VRGLHHVALLCADLEACERFYREALGLQVLRRWPGQGGGDRSVWLDAGDGTFLALERAAATSGEGPGVGPGWHVLALRIEPGDRQAVEAQLAARGVAVVRRTPHTLFVLDPEGNRVGLSHWPAEAP